MFAIFLQNDRRFSHLTSVPYSSEDEINHGYISVEVDPEFDHMWEYTLSMTNEIIRGNRKLNSAELDAQQE